MTHVIVKETVSNVIRNELRERTRNNFLLRVDRNIASILLEKKMPIRRLDGIFMLHYYHMVEETADKRGVK
jgi:hypothetical protein